MANRTLDIVARWTPNSTFTLYNCSSPPSSLIQPRKEPWIIPLVVLSSVNVTAILLFEIYVLYKSCGSRRHLFLGQILLLGLFLSSLLGFAFVPSPSWFTCALTRTGVGIAYVLVFATLLVKCVFLLSLHVGVYLSAAYQGLLLFFAVAVQLVIAVQWTVYRPHRLTSPCAPACATPFPDTAASLAYCMVLMAALALLAVRARAVPENHGEALCIGVAMSAALPLWLAWTVASGVWPRHHEACLAFGVVLNASLVFVVVFLPKGRQLAAMGRGGAGGGGAYTDDGFSSVGQSMYTPSFLHLKPPQLVPFVKQGTLVKPLTSSSFPTHPAIERGYFIPPQHNSRLWRYSHHPATLQLPPLHSTPEDIYLASERFLFGPPGMKLYRPPLY